MKRIIAKVLTLLLAFMVLTPASTVSATLDYECYSENVEQILTYHDSESVVDVIIPLLGNDDSTVAILCILHPIGYVIMDSCTGGVIEYSLECESPFENVEGDKLYYGGPMQYFCKIGDCYQHCKSDEYISEEEFSIASNDFCSKTKEVFSEVNDGELISNAEKRTLNLTSLPEVSIPKTTIVDGLRTFDYNPNGCCGSTAAAILLAYYDDEVDNEMVDDSKYLSDDSGEAFVKYLYPEIEGIIAGSYTMNVQNGLNWYLRQVGFDTQYQAVASYDASFSLYISCIMDSVPVILDLDAHPTYDEHWVIGYGMESYMNSSSLGDIYHRMAIVNNGWGSNDIYINWDYVADVVFLQAAE